MNGRGLGRNLAVREHEDRQASVQNMKVRRLQQNLFLGEMERLADALCTHYVDARRDVAGVAEADIQTHVESIQGRVHSMLAKEAQRQTAAASTAQNGLVAGLRGARPVRLEGLGGSESNAGDGRAGTAASSVGGFTEGGDSSTGGTDGWTAQSARGAASRLRTQRGVPVSLMTSEQYHQQTSRNVPRSILHGTVSSGAPRAIDDANLLVVNRFDDLTNPKAAALLDVNMDGNSHALSARRPKKVPSLKDPVSVGEARLKDSAPAALPQLTMYPLERVPTPPQDKRVPLPWSPRDPLHNTAKAVVNVRRQHDAKRGVQPVPPPKVGLAARGPRTGSGRFRRRGSQGAPAVLQPRPPM